MALAQDTRRNRQATDEWGISLNARVARRVCSVSSQLPFTVAWSGLLGVTLAGGAHHGTLTMGLRDGMTEMDGSESAGTVAVAHALHALAAGTTTQVV